MNCNFDKLVLYLDKRLDLDGQLEVLGHLDECDTCRDAVHQISRDRDSSLFVTKPYRLEKIPAR
jgi:predicted anti-sigma-YlaC factor YlaD